MLAESVGLQGGSAEMREFVEFMHAHGLEKVVELPIIAVVGDTSSGKSSLLTAMRSPLGDVHTLPNKAAARATLKGTLQREC